MSTTPLARLLGPDLLEVLDEHIEARIEQHLAAREADRRWMTVSETAVYLGISEKAVYHRVANGTLPYSRDGRRVMVDRRRLDEQLAARGR
jgi:excisionase family DNA binding protein